MHYRLPVMGYRIGSMAYITDMKTIEQEELDKLKGVEVLIVNALRKEPHLSHMNLEEALSLIKKINPRQAYLTHVSHMMGLSENIALELPSNVSLAYDGLSFDL
jgi:phosphoribosyl 1,2-cyclic phosphate phosphodiesterase